MSVSPDQLGEINRALRQAFDDHPTISISATKGNPPEQYEIVYRISGYSKTGRSDPKCVDEHRIELTIPFGFPHFPPSCKPKSDIFHPDFDPAAVCLGDFWQPGIEVTDLIIHLGRLINGEQFSTDNAFNEEAAKWYKEHRALFPLAAIAWTSAHHRPEADTVRSLPEIDTIEDADLSSDFDFLSLEGIGTEERAVQTSISKEKTAENEEDLAYLKVLRGRRKFTKLHQILTNTPPVSTEAIQLLSLCVKEIGRAEELYQSAKQVEAAGNIKNAARMFQEVSSIVSDFPNLDVDRRRTDDLLKLIDEKSGTATDRDEDQIQQNGFEAVEQPQAKKPRKFEEIKKPARPPVAVKSGVFATKTVLLTLSFLAGFFACGSYAISYFSTQQLQGAKKELATCNDSLANNNFEEAQRACKLALSKASPLFGFNKAESDTLAAKINETLSSEKLLQGLAGKVLFNDKYLPKNEVMALESFSRLQKEAEAVFSQQQWSEAEERYLKLLALAEKGPVPEANSVKDIKNRLAYLRFAKTFSKATALIADGRWQEATGELQKAKGLLGSLPEEDRRRHEAELNAALAKCNFEEFRKLGDDFFSKSDWTNAINTYKAALPTADKGDLASQETLKELRENIARAELYAAIDAGNKAFTSSNWEEAIVEYNKAGNILSSQLETIKTADAQFTRKKIDRIILQTMVIRDRQAAQTAEIDKKDPISARNIYRQLVATLNKSGFAGEEEFAEIKKTSLVAIEGLDKKIYLGEKENYLKDNFRNLFQQNYPAAVAENLNNPQVIFVRETDSKLIFKMQCNETGQGRPLTLIMFYAYDKSSNLWQFHSEQQ
jgi:ubiquitin-protein ligase